MRSAGPADQVQISSKHLATSVHGMSNKPAHTIDSIPILSNSTNLSGKKYQIPRNQETRRYNQPNHNHQNIHLPPASYPPSSNKYKAKAASPTNGGQKPRFSHNEPRTSLPQTPIPGPRT
ncbi:hypothetical protein BST61_g10747 [Cercospora zeina]